MSSTENREAPDLTPSPGEPTVSIPDCINDMLDRCISVIVKLPACRENSLAITKIEEAQMWLNKGDKK